MVPPLVVLLHSDPRFSGQGDPYSPPTTLLAASTREIKILVPFEKYVRREEKFPTTRENSTMLNSEVIIEHLNIFYMKKY